MPAPKPLSPKRLAHGLSQIQAAYDAAIDDPTPEKIRAFKRQTSIHKACWLFQGDTLPSETPS